MGFARHGQGFRKVKKLLPFEVLSRPTAILNSSRKLDIDKSRVFI